MANFNQPDRESFFFPRAQYHGPIKPDNLVFNANFQEFAQKVSYISALETSGKLSPAEAYSKIRVLWKQLKRSAKQLGVANQSKT